MKKSTAGNLVLRFTGSLIRLLIDIIFYVFVIMLLIKATRFAYNFTYQTFGSVSVEASPGTDVSFTIGEGDTTMSIATRLETSRLIVDRYSFYVKTKLKTYVIMPGTYTLNTSMNYSEILAVITGTQDSKDDAGQLVTTTAVQETTETSVEDTTAADLTDTQDGN
jgi:UPF0755 protein